MAAEAEKKWKIHKLLFSTAEQIKANIKKNVFEQTLAWEFGIEFGRWNWSFLQRVNLLLDKIDKVEASLVHINLHVGKDT